METAAVWAVSLVFWFSLAFMLVVSTFWRWWRSPLGRAFLTFDIFMTIALFPSELFVLFGIPTDTPAWQWAAISGFFLIASVIPWKTWVLFRVQAGTTDAILTNRQAYELLKSQLRRLRRGSISSG